MDMDVVSNKERLLKGILDGEATTDIEPASREERLLKAILEKCGGGGGGGGATSVTLTASGSDLSGDVSLADLKTALANGVVLLSFPTEGDSDVRAVVEYTDDSTNGLEIGVFGEDEYIIYSVVDDGNDGVTLTVVSESVITQTIELTDNGDGTVSSDIPWSLFIHNLQNGLYTQIHVGATADGVRVDLYWAVSMTQVTDAEGLVLMARVIAVGYSNDSGTDELTVLVYNFQENATTHKTDGSTALYGTSLTSF